MVFNLLGILEKTITCLRVLVENDVLNAFAQFGFDLVVDGEHSRVDDPHVEARLTGMIEEAGMHGFTYQIISTERERYVAYAPTRAGMGATRLNFPHSFDEVYAVGIVFGHSGCKSQDVRVENDIFGRKTNFLDEDFVSPFANPDLVVQGCSLAFLVKGHDYYGSPIP